MVGAVVTAPGGPEEVTMSTVLDVGVPITPARRLRSTAAAAALAEPVAEVLDPSWLTATIRPAGSFGRQDTSRLRALLDALAACASIVVLDLQVARLRSARAAEVIEDAAWDLERRGGCLLCINVDAEARASLTAAGDHAVLMDHGPHLVDWV
jgi:hypothetical protein